MELYSLHDVTSAFGGSIKSIFSYQIHSKRPIVALGRSKLAKFWRFTKQLNANNLVLKDSGLD